MFLVLADQKRGVHGVDYVKNLNGRECGRVHEFETWKCHPLYVTEDELDRYYPDQVVEILPFFAALSTGDKEEV
jgi:hypothetical protein